MGCCKCEEYGWKIEPCLEAEYHDDNGAYCVFHAPLELKLPSDDSSYIFLRGFSERLKEYVIAGINGGHTAEGYPYCDLSGVVFPGEVRFDRMAGCKELPRVTFEDAIFTGDVNFGGVIFDGGVNFAWAQFVGDSSFRHCKFNVEALFSRAAFNGPVDFSKAEFSGQALFDSCSFAKSVRYTSVQFHDSASFNECKFLDQVFIQSANFSGKTIFTNTEFVDKVKFNVAIIRGHMLFSECTAKNRSVYFHFLDAMSVENIDFHHSFVSAMSFSGCSWPARLGCEKYSGVDGRQVSEELYRAMKQRALEEHDQQQASHWHFREKLMKLKQICSSEASSTLFDVVEDTTAKLSTRAQAWFKLLWHRPHWPKLTLIGLYWASSGFGERAVRAGVCLGILVGLSFLFNSIQQPWDWSALPGSAAANATMATIPFAKDIPGDGWVKVGRGFWQFLIAVQFTLFALAVRNRFRR